jgi:hypothetical protein
MSTIGNVVGFCQGEGDDYDHTFASGSSQSKGDSYVEIISLVAECFEVYERDSHAHNLMITDYGLLI